MSCNELFRMDFRKLIISLCRCTVDLTFLAFCVLSVCVCVGGCNLMFCGGTEDRTVSVV